MSPSPNHPAAAAIAGHLEDMERHPKVTGSTSQNGLSDVSMVSSGLNLMHEDDRIKTFENWPVSFMDVHELAKAGFYYIKKGDLVKCAYCSIEVGRWMEGDNPLDDHRKHSPSCRFVKCLDQGTNLETSDPTPNGYDVCGPYGAGAKKPIDPEDKSKQETLQRLGLFVESEPTYPNYTTLESRLRSFESWPISLKIKPDALSDAGFFYTTTGDKTMCFHCGGGLKDWQETDDAWVEHARHFSKCNYVLLAKGKEFVDACCGKTTEILPMTQEEMRAVIENHSSVPVPAVDVPPIERNSQESCSSQTEIGKDNISAAVSRNDSNDSLLLCRVCYSDERTMAFLPCGHLAVCSKCGIGLKTCVVCRAPCEVRVRIIIS